MVLLNGRPGWDRCLAVLGLLLTILIYALQVPFSHWWMKRFRYGPAEWLWRSLTYLKRQPMRRTI